MARVKPSVRIHIDVPDHDRTAEVWGELEGRAMLVELWRLGLVKFAGKNGDRLPLTKFDRMQIACTTDEAAADSSLRSLCKRLRYPLRVYPNRWVVTIRNFAKSQGFQTKELGEKFGAGSKELSPPNPNPNPNPNPIPRREEEAGSAPLEAPAFALSEPGPRRPKKAKQANEDQRVVAAWPAIREAFKTHGRALGDSLRPDRARCILQRINEGATASDLVAAVHGYVDFHGGLEPQTDRNGVEFNPGQFFRVETIFKADGFSDRVDRGAGGGDGAGGDIGRMMARAGVK